MRIQKALAIGLVGMLPALTGCLSHTFTVPKTRPAEIVYDATLDQLLHQVDIRYDAIQSISASVEIVASEGGGRQGKVVVHPSFSGYIFIRKPENLRVLLRLPILGSQAMDMVSDGKVWKLWIPPRKLAMTGTSDQPDPSQHGLESLRPAVIFDSLLINGLAQDQIVSLTQDTRIIQNEKNKKDLIEEPDFDLEILERPKSQTANTRRVIHISRVNLLPYQLDIYGSFGTVVTRALYSNYQKFNVPKSGEIQFPMKVEIRRPQDNYTLTITFLKLTLNQAIEDDQFDLKIPEGIPIKTMN